MWRRWGNPNGNRAPLIGHPTLIDTTMEEGYLETIPEVESLKSKRSSETTILPELPFRAMPPMQRIPQQHKEPAWSQPSPTIPDYHSPVQYSPYDDQYHEISPPSSPRKSIPDHLSEETPISPIEAELPFGRHIPLTNDPQKSRIPRRAVSKANKAAETPGKTKEETRWDAYSGEPTKDDSGLPSSVKLGIQPLEFQYPQLKERTMLILAGIREREAASKPGLNVQPAPDLLDHPAYREPWKGASGRTALVDPVQNHPSARDGLIHPAHRNANQVEQPRYQPRAESPTHTLRTVASEESIKPIAPLKINTKSRNVSPQTSMESATPPFQDTIQSAPPIFQHHKTLQSPFSSPGLIREIDMPMPLDNTRADSPPYDLAPDTPRTPPPTQHHTMTPIKEQQMPSEPDVSRFSWTTYTTSVNGSPGNLARVVRDESPPPPLPQMTRLQIRKRPVSGAYPDTPSIRKHATPSQNSIVPRKPVAGRNRTSSATVYSQLSLSKTLPQIPPEIEAKDNITNFQAQLNALAMRKHNTTRIIRDMNESLKKNAIIYDQWKRKDIGDRIANQESELQAITNEEHDIGLLLHRAQRKRDREDCYEQPTGLWVRRVTSEF